MMQLVSELSCVAYRATAGGDKFTAIAKASEIHPLLRTLSVARRFVGVRAETPPVERKAASTADIDCCFFAEAEWSLPRSMTHFTPVSFAEPLYQPANEHKFRFGVGV